MVGFGALLNYWILGQLIGKPFLEKYRKYILITKEKYDKTETLFLKNLNLQTFFGATLWCAILVGLGWFFGELVVAIVKEYTHEVTLIVVPLIAIYIWWKIWGKK